jgi:hypothetical protein
VGVRRRRRVCTRINECVIFVCVRMCVCVRMRLHVCKCLRVRAVGVHACGLVRACEGACPRVLVCMCVRVLGYVRLQIGLCF